MSNAYREVEVNVSWCIGSGGMGWSSQTITLDNVDITSQFWVSGYDNDCEIW